MDDGTGARRCWWRRASTVISLGVAMAVAVTTPALGHPVFSNDGPGFPNPQGSTATPYPAGSRPTLNMFVPFEQDGVIFNGAVNTTVDVKITVPASWTSSVCGAASTSTGNRQVGTVVSGWTCTIETVSAHQVLHWHGPQVSPAQSESDSAQFFTFPVTVPSPAVQTSYGVTEGAEGFYVEQAYANGATSLWRTPNSTRPGKVANGIIRTVSKSTVPPPKPTGSPPPPEQEHGGPPPPAAKPAGATPTGSPSPHQSGLTPSPSGGPPSTGPSTVVDSPGATSTDTPSPQPVPAVEQLTQEHDDATGRGVRWQVLVGVALGVLVVGAAIAVARLRRRSS
ncbi:MAG: hypothetical protein ACRDRQ_10895 [Pseudonocardiaceae bacterium]